jgi:hypothetical protein
MYDAGEMGVVFVPRPNPTAAAAAADVDDKSSSSSLSGGKYVRMKADLAGMLANTVRCVGAAMDAFGVAEMVHNALCYALQAAPLPSSSSSSLSPPIPVLPWKDVASPGMLPWLG